MNDHTKGPFVVVENDGAYVKERGMATLRIEERATDYEMVVALIVTDCELCRDKAREVAGLFAAAPDLLAACESAMEAIDDAYEKTGFIRVAKTSHQRLAIEAAIAKAKGGPK